MACASCVLASRRDWGLADRGRSRSAARKHMASHGPRTGRAMRRERRALDAPCGRFEFLKRPRRGPVAGQPVLLCDEPLFVGRMLARDRRVSCRDGTLHLLLRRSLWHRDAELPSQKHSLVEDGRKPRPTAEGCTTCNIDGPMPTDRPGSRPQPRRVFYRFLRRYKALQRRVVAVVLYVVTLL
jgi:hypothetical protein